MWKFVSVKMPLLDNSHNWSYYFLKFAEVCCHFPWCIFARARLMYDGEHHSWSPWGWQFFLLFHLGFDRVSKLLPQPWLKRSNPYWASLIALGNRSALRVSQLCFQLGSLQATPIKSSPAFPMLWAFESLLPYSAVALLTYLRFYWAPKDAAPCPHCPPRLFKNVLSLKSALF